jgi:hypothetical protein
VEEIQELIESKYKRESGRYRFKENKKLLKQLYHHVYRNYPQMDAICYPIIEKPEEKPVITDEIVNDFIRSHILKDGIVEVSQMLRVLLSLQNEVLYNLELDTVMSRLICYLVEEDLMVSPMYGMFEPNGNMAQVFGLEWKPYDIFTLKKIVIKNHITFNQ